MAGTQAGHELQVGTWQQELKERLLRNAAHWLFPHDWLSLYSGPATQG